MENKKYRVELFITPQCNNEKAITSSMNAHNDKYINEVQLDIIEEVSENEYAHNIKSNFTNDENTSENIFSTQTEKTLKELIEELPMMPNEQESKKLIENIYLKTDTNQKYIEDHIYDEPFVGNLNPNKANSLKDKIKHLRYSHKYHPQPPLRSSSLKCIDESMEILEQTFQDICYHGYKDGCTVAVKQPEQVSQEIFKENWLQKLESLRQREALLRDKEIALQSQERLLFKKERQLRILERLIQDKMKQAELYLKRCKLLPGLENIVDIEQSSESGCSHSSRGSKCSKTGTEKESRDSYDTKSHDLHIYDEITMKNPPNSRSSIVTASTDIFKMQHNLASNINCIRSSKFAFHNSFRLKQKPKLTYDDLDSTLSADIGDSSFGVTTMKFNPNMFKKPIAFQRSVNEKNQTYNTRPSIINPINNIEKHGLEETKIFKKFSENIMVSQNKDTKFQNYGLIDNGMNVNYNNTRPKSVNDAELVNQKKPYNTNTDKYAKDVNTKTLKHSNRPISWNAENDDWLQKKRQQYNLSMRRVPMKHNKENHQMETNVDKRMKSPKKEKKENKNKKFMIFR